MPHTRRPSFLRKEVQHGLRLVKLTSLHCDIGQHGCRESQPRREISFLEYPQRDPRGRVSFGQGTEPQFEQAQGGVGGHEAPRRTAALNPGQHRSQALLDRAEALGHDQHPQQRRARVPVLSLQASLR